MGKISSQNRVLVFITLGIPGHSEVPELQRKEVPRFPVNWALVIGWELSVPGSPLHPVSEHRAGCYVLRCILHLSLLVGHSEQGHFLCASGTSLGDEEDCLPTYAQVRLN